MATTKLFILYITSNSEMMLVDSNKSLPNFNINIPIENNDLDIQLKKFINEDGLKDINYDFSRYKLCNSNSDVKCVILKVTDSEKNTIETKSKNKYKFFKTYDDDINNTRKINPTITNLETETQNLFVKFQYLSDKNGNPLDKCIKDAKEPPRIITTNITTFKFYRPIYPLILKPVPEPIFSFLTYPNNPVYPTVISPIVVSPFVSPIQSRSSSPIIDKRFDRYEPAPKVARSPKNVSPKVPRTEVNRVMKRTPKKRNQGGYYEKYLKYKTKYLNLKNELNDNNI